MPFQSFKALEDRAGSEAAFNLLTVSLQKNAQLFPNHLVGWQGGSRRRNVYWLAALEIWTVLDPQPPDNKKGPRQRFWNCFGIDNPAENQMLTITVEINPPHEGRNPRLAGLFARDGSQDIFLCHTGKVGGGRAGIGQKAFRKFSEDLEWKEIAVSSGTQTALALGPIDEASFPRQVAELVHYIARFKARD